MGHYASEMAGPPVRHDPEVLEGRRLDVRAQAQFLWQLYQQREQQGAWIESDQELVCPRCFAKLPALLREDHDGWHRDEQFRMEPGLVG